MPTPDPFTPFLSHHDIRQRRVSRWGQSQPVDDFLDAPDRAALERRFAPSRAQGLLAVAAAVAAIIFLRMIHLQVVSGATYRDQAEFNRLKREFLPAPRGIIQDRTGRLLTINEPTFVLRVNPRELPRAAAERTRLLDGLGSVLSISRQELEQQLQNVELDGGAEIARDLSITVAIRLFTAYGHQPGISVLAAAKRAYPLSAAASHLIGYLGKPTNEEIRQGYAPTDLIGRSGLEAQYEAILRGKNGRREIERDSLNRAQRVVATEPSTPGRDVTLTIDADLQQRLYDELTAAVKRSRAPGGAAVALAPQTGEILALVSVPSFDSNLFSASLKPETYQLLTNDPKLPLFFRAVAGEYPSGSTIKPFIAGAALDEKVITPQTQILSSGGIAIGSWFFPDWKAGGHGATTVTKAIAESVNTFFYTVGGGFERFDGLGIGRMTEYVRRFGFGQRLGIDLPGERPGFLPSKEWKERVKQERWYIGDTYHFAIGQGDLLITPLQLAAGTATIANGGTLYRPHVLQAVGSFDRVTVERVKPEILQSRTVSASSLRTVREGMREAVVSGSARALADLPVPAAAKTGTAQFGPTESTHAWFTAFAPYDHPSIVITVLIEKGGEGHAAALPVARNVLSWYFTRG